MRRYKLIKKGRNPYDLSSLKWVCEKCGGEKHSGSPYEPIGMRKICMCKK